MSTIAQSFKRRNEYIYPYKSGVDAGLFWEYRLPMALAPPFTRENAADNARKAVASREKRRAAAHLQKIIACEPDKAQTRLKLQIDKVLGWMEKCHSKDDFAELASTLDRLWNKAFPTQGAVKSRQAKRDREPLKPVETPQPVVPCGAQLSPASPQTPQDSASG